MSSAETHCRWTWRLQSPPEALWPLVSNTDRFNRDCGFPTVAEVPPGEIRGDRPSDSRRLRARRWGLLVEWDERPFDWISPQRFGVERVFHRGPFASIRALCDLIPTDAGGTTIVYQTWFTPANLLGQLALKLGAHRWQFRQPFARVFRAYDEHLVAGRSSGPKLPKVNLNAGAHRRLRAIRDALHRLNQPAGEIDRLLTFITSADDLSVRRIRPYALADLWGSDRRRMLQLFLHATRAGLLDFTWDILCPLCRGAKAVVPRLDEIQPQVHCEACGIDFTSNLEQSVELTFHPNPTLRDVPRQEYCVGGPQVTPHIVAQQRLPAGQTVEFPLRARPGRYRLRTLPTTTTHFLRIAPESPDRLAINLATPTADELPLADGGTLALHNDTGGPLRLIVEHLGWTDQAATAREVTCLQTFRDLFSREVLRPGEQISVGSLTLVFTDIRGSTRLYREIGDAPAFGRVLSHFALLHRYVDEGGGAIIKTMGDAIMAAFPSPDLALKTLLRAQARLAQPRPDDPHSPIVLKIGMHHGPCIAINQNDRLDYFGSTVNLASRLGDLSDGTDVVVSDTVYRDPGIADLLAGHGPVSHEVVRVHGFDREHFRIWRIPGGSRPSARAGLGRA